MRNSSRAFLLLLLLVPVSRSGAQTTHPSDASQARWLFDTEFGSGVQLGNKLSSTAFGPSFEIPRWNRYEFQGNLSLLPTQQIAGHDAHSLQVGGAGIVWVNNRIGAGAGFQHTWLWTPKVSKSGWSPLLTFVLRDQLYRPGRLYVTYLFPTGCSARAANADCRFPSGRPQGPQVLQELRLFPHFRLGVHVGLFHFCASSALTIMTDCHWAGSESVRLRFEFGSQSSLEPY
jgi:hypothetical protein